MIAAVTSRLRTWARALTGRAAYENEMDAEMRFHIDAYADDLMRTSANREMSREEALRRARLKFGTVDRSKEECRDAQGVSMLENLMQDLRFAFRTMRRSPGFTAIAVLSLGLGIGANTAIFTLINDLMLKSLPVRDPQQLVSFGQQNNAGVVDGITGSMDIFTYEFYKQIQQHDEAFTDVTAYCSFPTSITVRRSSANGVTTAQSHLVSGNFFSVLGATTALGRPLDPADDNGTESRPVAVISDHYWRQYFSSDPAVIGTSIIVNSTPITIVGVAAPKFYGVQIDENPPDMWLPLGLQPQVMLNESLLGPHGLYWLQAMARSKPGVSRAQAQTWLTTQLRQYMTAREGTGLTPETKRDIDKSYVELFPGAEGVSRLRSQYQTPLMILMCIVAVVLLIACANLANFLLAKTASREHEIATRLALGAGRWRVVRQMLTEALLLSFSGCLLGLVLAYWGTRALIAFVATGAKFTPFEATPDVRVLAFSFSVSLLTGILFGIGPALRVSRMAMDTGMRSSARTVAGDGSRLSRAIPKILVAAQVAMSLVLLVGAGLFLRTLRNLENQNFGFNRSNLLLVNIDPKLAGYKPDQLSSFYRQTLDRIGALPGVQSAALSGVPPMSRGSWMGPIMVKGQVTKPDDDTLTTLNSVSPNYFKTIETPLLQGRTVEPRDTMETQHVVVVNETLASHLFPKGGAVGQSVTFGQDSLKGDWEIIGVVKDTRYGGPRETPRRIVYLPLAQLTEDNAYASWIQVRTDGDPARAASSVRAALAEIDSNLPVTAVRTIQEHVELFTNRESLISQISIFFALLALLLVCIGLYGVMTYAVVRRTNEIGIRMALGAQQDGVLWMILRESLAVLAIGVAIGIPATLATMRLIQAGLFGLSSSDPLTLVVAVAMVAAVTLFAAYLPARRATKVDPMVALRYE
jgi:predicted permease